MPADQWEQIKTIFAAASELEGSDRTDYLAGACAGRPELLRVVQELLENDDATPTPDRAAHAPSPVFHSGELIAGRFRIVRFIAAGGMGEVYEAFDTSLDNRIALKTLRPEMSATPEALGRFKREILVAHGVAHENLCKIFDFVEHRPTGPDSNGEHRVIPCLTMEFLDGITLADYLSSHRPLPLITALPLIRQIAEALDCLHRQGILHRDLKPANIMLTLDRGKNFKAIVTDFGLARPEEATTDLFSSFEPMQAGAPYYMAPELFRGGKHGIASDLYAFGLVIDEMVTVSRAFSARSLQALCYAKLCEEPIPPRIRNPELPEPWDRTILRCLQRDPTARPASATEAAGLLTQQTMPAQARTLKKPWAAKRTLWAIAGATSLLLAGAVLAPVVLGPGDITVEVFEIDNQTNEHGYDYLCRGITSELMRRLTRLGEVHVVPLYSTRAHAPQRKPSRYSLDGILQAHNGQIRLTANVIDNQDGRLVWSENFDNRTRNPLELEAEIATGAMMAFEKSLFRRAPSGSDRAGWLAGWRSRAATLLRSTANAQVAPPPTSSNQALDAYMKGRYLRSQGAPESIIAAIAELRRAVAEDPRFALAYAALADVHIALTYYSYVRVPELVPEARRFAETAVSLDPNLAEGWEALALVNQRDWDWPGAEGNYLRALRIKPGLASARRNYAGLLIQFGRLQEGVAEARKAFAQDPYNPSVPAGYGLNLFMAGLYAECIAILEPAAQRGNALGAAHNLGDAYALLASLETGPKSDELYRKAFEQAARVAGMEQRVRDGQPGDTGLGTPWSDQMYAHYYSMRRELAAAQPFLERMIADMEAGRTSPSNVAMIYVAQGQNGKALDLLDRAVSLRDQFVPLTKVMPFFKSLRAEPRFQRMLSEIRL